MKRILIGMAAAGLVCTFPATALAGKPNKPEPATVNLTMTGNVATTCAGPLTMVFVAEGMHRLDAFDQAWAEKCVYLTLEGLEPGCYCGYHEDNQDPDAFAGLFRLNEARHGTVELISQFERLWFVTYDRKGRPGSTLHSAYSLEGVLNGPFSWVYESGGGTLTGELILQSFYKEVGSAGGTWKQVSTTPVSITVEW